MHAHSVVLPDSELGRGDVQASPSPVLAAFPLQAMRLVVNDGGGAHRHPESDLATIDFCKSSQGSAARCRVRLRLARLARQQPDAATDMLSWHSWVFKAPNLWRSVCSRGRDRDQRKVPAANVGANSVMTGQLLRAMMAGRENRVAASRGCAWQEPRAASARHD
ncbi:uncharacterized protein M421DRAFT_198800 [Didymella exigua CBS 183.55]|uniref:Uncharacterized protein n=1 Tax=Didymella exigua CBS 183.55 TaxID=1150837 RepID=A0A6A5RYC9_9PLEO|nr:uncharacterized protein M421DRAFT_198800 [Didymella exigua CBS 183.55]KAF1933485.1 hypothetical protein M421DRAFT_198800 [Didymella exigua CBS 183.55]